MTTPIVLHMAGDLLGMDRHIEVEATWTPDRLTVKLSSANEWADASAEMENGKWVLDGQGTTPGTVTELRQPAPIDDDPDDRPYSVNRLLEVHGLTGVTELLDKWGYAPRVPIERLAADNSTHDGPAAAEFLLNNPHLWEIAFTNDDLDAIHVLPAKGQEFRLAVDLANFGHDDYNDVVFGDADGNRYTFIYVWWD